MKVQIYFQGKTNEKYLRVGEEVYQKRLRHYFPLEVGVLPDVRNSGKLTAEALKEKEADGLLQQLSPQDGLILLDERGERLSSLKFAKWMDKQLQRPYRRLVFAVGGAFGFSPRVYERANGSLRLSDMTFSHQMVRLFFLEQLYRAGTILRGESYHNE